MKKKIKLPSGMGCRLGRDGSPTYNLKAPSGKKVWLGKNYRYACLQWVELQKWKVKQSPPTTALDLLTAFQQCSLPLPSEEAAIRRRAELANLRRFFADHNDPPLHAITSEGALVIWHMSAKRPAPLGRVIGLFRHIWRFALDLEFCDENCPWKPFDLTNARRKMEAVDVVRGFSTGPLKALLEELLGKAGMTTDEQIVDPTLPRQRHQLLVQLRQAVACAVEALRACGRMDLIVPVYELTLDDLVALRGSPVLALTRPPGRILLGHRRKEQLNSILLREKAALEGQKTDRLHEDRTTAKAADVGIVTLANSLEEKR
ncbi:hypothetical protein QFZ99_002058 [Paraburkholderia atlantica]|uniref:hypothetical protein n=1 Tax=Paraburkholderia atlantica TaxID=2654982 RepID=UPI003D26101B